MSEFRSSVAKGIRPWDFGKDQGPEDPLEMKSKRRGVCIGE
jgi:hypothetical protein